MKEQLVIEEKPLKGRRVILTRSKKDLVSMGLKLRRLGAITIEIPSLRFVRSSRSEMDELAQKIGSFDWIVFTSVNAVQFFLERMKSEIIASFTNIGIKIAATGPATAGLLVRNGVRVDFIPEEFLTAQIGEKLPEVKGKQILLPRSNLADKRLAFTLKKRGAIVSEITAYRTVMPQSRIPSLSNIVDGDFILFASASSVHNFVKLIGTRKQESLRRVISAVCIGPVTAEVAQRYGFRVKTIAKTHTIDGLVTDLIRSISAA
ncbi:MAG: uroporphyrinogen-III synthase [Thaumarchaeota archaeon]|nr:uroporphyrinogen-III synthase [Nitrososphaerota archaeon]